MLTKKPCRTFILKYDTQNYFRPFKKTLSICFQWNTAKTEMLMFKCVWSKYLNVTAKCSIVSNEKVALLDKNFETIKLFKIRGTIRYHKNVKCIKFSKNDLLKSIKLEFSISFYFSQHLEKKMLY